MIELLPFHASPPTVSTGDEVSKDMDIFFWNEAYFLPEGKGFDNLTDEEKHAVRTCYRFDPYRPGINYGGHFGGRYIGGIVFGRTRSGISY